MEQRHIVKGDLVRLVVVFSYVHKKLLISRQRNEKYRNTTSHDVYISQKYCILLHNFSFFKLCDI